MNVDWQNEVVGRLLVMALNLKKVSWRRVPGLAGKYASDAVLETKDGVVLGEQAIILALDEAIKTDSFFPNGNRGMPIALAHWRDRIMAQFGLGVTAEYLVTQAGLVARQMHDNRLFLQGNAPSLADLNSAAWMLEPAIKEILLQKGIMAGWLERMVALMAAPDYNVPMNAIELLDLVQEQVEKQRVSIKAINIDAEAQEADLLGANQDLILIELSCGTKCLVSPLGHQIER